MRRALLSSLVLAWAAAATGCAGGGDTRAFDGVLADASVKGAPPTSSGGGATAPAGGEPGAADSGAGGGDTGGPPTGSGDAGVTADTGSPPPPACTATPEWKPGDAKTIAITYGGVARSYDVYVGKSVAAGAAVPLLVNVHGLNNNPAIQAQFSQMNPVADDEGFVIVYPAGLGASFNAGTCCGSSASSNVDDVGFIRAVVAEAETKICVDTRRVYETGFSNGGMMAYQLACNAADLFAAVAPTEGSNMTTTPCNPARPVPLAAFESLGDPVVLPASAQASVQGWATKLGCTDAAPTSTTTASFTCDQWSACGGGASAWYCTLPGGTHLPPAGSAPVIWSFLSQYRLP